MSKKLYIRTYGCQMNVYDSARMAEVLAPFGYTAVAAAEDADMVILNTCHIREKAAEKLFSDLGRLRPLKARKAESGQRLVLAVAGCVAQAEGAEILARAPYVDLVLGPQTYHRLPEMVARLARQHGPVLDTEFPAEPKFDFLPETAAPQGVSAFLSVQEGCDKFCTFCVVPYTRGAEFSRAPAAILAEARRLLANGAREITLLGQNVNAYHGAGPSGETHGLGRLIRDLAELPGLLRLRYTTSHPADMDDDLIAAHRDVPSLMPFLHLPVQSGSDRVLAAMNRRHSAADYRRIIDRLRARAARHRAVVRFHRRLSRRERRGFRRRRWRSSARIGFAQAFSFKYSPRPGTPAAALADQVPDDDKSRAPRNAAGRSPPTSSADFNRSLRRHGHAGAVREAGTAPRPACRPQPVHAGGACPGSGELPRRAVLPIRIAGIATNSLSGTVAMAEAAA